MSETTTPAPSVIVATPAVNQAIAAAKSLPGLISNLEAVSPGLAAQLETKPLLMSRSPWGVAVASLIGMAVAHYGLPALDPQTTALLSGCIVLAFSMIGAYVMRFFTKSATAGIIATPPATPPAVASVPSSNTGA